MFRRLVDEHTGQIWISAAEPIVPVETLPVAIDGHAVQSRLRAHASSLRSLTSGQVQSSGLEACLHISNTLCSLDIV